MAYPSVTYTFANSTTSDATQVNQNFTDIINGLSDGTKDLNINAITASGAATLNGAVTIGNGSPDDITIGGSLASTIAIKTTFSYDFGSSTIGWKSFYLGSSDSAAKTVRLMAGVIGSSYTFTLPTGAGSAGQAVVNLGSGSTAFLSGDCGSKINLGLSAGVNANALTMSLKGADGNDPSSSSPVIIVFRNATSGTGTPVVRAVTSALSTVISSGSTAGFVSAKTHYINWYAIDNAGTVELAWSGGIFDPGAVVTTTAEGGAGAADSGYTMYSTTARSNVACTWLGRTKHSLTTAGTWDEVPDEISVGEADKSGNRSRIFLNSGNGHGSSNTRIRRFTTASINLGPDMTLTQSGTNGDSITINADGVYAFIYHDYRSASTSWGISLNSTQLTTNIASITTTDILSIINCPTASLNTPAVWVGRLRVNDVVRAHTDGSPNSTDIYSMFNAMRID